MLGHDLGVDSNCIHFVPNTSTALAVVLGGGGGLWQRI